MGAIAGYCVDERMNEITDAPPRVAALDPTLIDDAAMTLIKKLVGSVGHSQAELRQINCYLRTIIKHPAFEALVEIGRAVFGGEILARDRELAILRVAWVCGAPYEWGEHVKMAKQLGISAIEIEQVAEGSTCTAWAPFDRAILRGVEELVTDYMITDGTWEVFAGRWSEQQLIEFPIMVGQYIATACVQNTLRVRLSKDNAGLFLR